MTRAHVVVATAGLLAAGVVGGAGAGDDADDRSEVPPSVVERLPSYDDPGPGTPAPKRKDREPGLYPLPEAAPRTPGPVPIPRVRPTHPGPVQMPRVEPVDPLAEDLAPLSELLRRK